MTYITVISVTQTPISQNDVVLTTGSFIREPKFYPKGSARPPALVPGPGRWNTFRSLEDSRADSG
jgi:hypothetical protein